MSASTSNLHAMPDVPRVTSAQEYYSTLSARFVADAAGRLDSS